jgi:hypothetical protein
MDDRGDMSVALMLDGNAVAGELEQIFGRDMTVAVARCGGCGSDAAMGALMAFTRGPGVVLRCADCEGVVLRIVQTSRDVYLDVRGAAFVRMTAGPAVR